MYMYVYGDQMSNTTCLTHTFLTRGEACSKRN